MKIHRTYKPGSVYRLNKIFMTIADYRRILPSRVKIVEHTINEAAIDPYIELISLDPNHDDQQLPRSTLNLMYFQVIEYNEIWNTINET